MTTGGLNEGQLYDMELQTLEAVHDASNFNASGYDILVDVVPRLTAEIRRLHGWQPSPDEDEMIAATKLRRPRVRSNDAMARVRFLVDTVHPDHGYVSKGEVLVVDRIYVPEYEKLGIGEETDDDADKGREPMPEKPKNWGKYALPASGEAAGGSVGG